MPKIDTPSALPIPVNIGPSVKEEAAGYIPLTSFFNDPYVIAHMALAKEIGDQQQGGVIKKFLNKKDSFLNSEEKVKNMDYSIADGFLYRAHRSDSQTVMMMGITRNTEQNTSESFDDYLAKLFNHTASHGSQSAVLSFSSQKNKAKKFMSEEKILLKINADSEADRNEFISTPQLILQHGGRLLETGKIDRLTLISAIDQLNNKEHEFFYIGKPDGYHYGEVPPYKVESFGSGKKHNEYVGHLCRGLKREPLPENLVLREDKVGVCSNSICYPDVSSCLTVTLRTKNSLAGVHLTVASDKQHLKNSLEEIKKLAKDIPVEVIIGAPFSEYKKHVKDIDLNTRARLKKIISKVFPRSDIQMYDTSDIQSAHVFVSKSAIRHEDAAGKPVIGNRYPGVSAQNEAPERSNAPVTAVGVQGTAPEKSASAPATALAIAIPPEVSRLRTIVSLAELKEQSGRRELTPEQVRKALLEAGVQLAEVARHPGKEILEAITGDEITGSNYSQRSEALSGALAADYFTALDTTITDNETLSGDAAKSLLDSPLREYLTEHRGQINMHPWADGLSGAVNTPAVSQQHGKAVRALFTELKAEPAIGTAWAPGEPASARPGVELMTEKLRELASDEKAAEEKLTARVAKRDFNIREDVERIARIRVEEKAKRQETDKQAWNALRRHVAGMVAGGQDWRNSHARLREGIEARFSQAYHARMDAYQQDRAVAAQKLSAMLTNLADQLNAPARRSEADVSVPVRARQSVAEDVEVVNADIASKLDAIRGELDTAIQKYNDGLKNNLPEREMAQLLSEMERTVQKMESNTQTICEQMGATAGTGWVQEAPSRQAVDALMQEMEKQVMQDRLPDVKMSSRLPDVPQRSVRERGKEKIALERSAHDKVGNEYQGPAS